MLWIGLPLLALGLLLGGAVLLQAWRDHREALEAERRWGRWQEAWKQMSGEE